MNWTDFYASFEDAKRTMEQADRVATQQAEVLRGRLRRVTSTYVLRQLKKELRDFDAVTGLWKERK